jgi:hypothetical protein
MIIPESSATSSLPWRLLWPFEEDDEPAPKGDTETNVRQVKNKRERYELSTIHILHKTIVGQILDSNVWFRRIENSTRKIMDVGFCPRIRPHLPIPSPSPPLDRRRADEKVKEPAAKHLAASRSAAARDCSVSCHVARSASVVRVRVGERVCVS